MTTKKITDTETIATDNKAPVFTRKQFRNSKKFTKYRDIVAIVIGEDESCTAEECKRRIDEFLNRKSGRSVK